jgi:hypothetical protein
LCFFVNDLHPSNAGKPLRFEDFLLESFLIGCVRVIRDSRRSRQKDWGIASPSDAYHLPKILPQELKPFGRSGDDFGKVVLRVCGFLRRSSTDRREPFPDSPRLAESSQGTHRPFGEPFRQNSGFLLERSFVLHTVRACLPDSPPLLGRQSVAARQTIRSVHRKFPRLFGSFASFLVLPRVL